MNGASFRYAILTGAKRLREGAAERLRGTPVGGALRVVYRGCAPLWQNRLVRSMVRAARRPLYRADPRGYWQREGGLRYMRDEAYILGPESLTTRQGEFLAAAIARLGAARVLEVGCGYGRLLKELHGRLDATLMGADFSEPQLRAAREYLAPAALPLVLADATRGLPFDDGSFDLVYTQGSLMHVPDGPDRPYCAELARVTRRWIVHTEDVVDSETTFAHDTIGRYRALGFSVVSDEPYPLNLPGQTMRFQVFAAPSGRGGA